MMTNWRQWYPGAFLLVLPVICWLGCGYRVASKNRVDTGHRTIAVKTLRNETSAYQVEQVLTRGLARELIRKSAYQLVSDPSRADLVLDGAVSYVRVSPVTFGRASFGSTFLVTLQARVQLTDRNSGETVFRNNDYIFREQYVINVQIENFFSELNPALERISDDFASSVVTSIMEGF